MHEGTQVLLKHNALLCASTLSLRLLLYQIYFSPFFIYQFSSSPLHSTPSPCFPLSHFLWVKLRHKSSLLTSRFHLYQIHLSQVIPFTFSFIIGGMDNAHVQIDDFDFIYPRDTFLSFYFTLFAFPDFTSEIFLGKESVATR